MADEVTRPNLQEAESLLAELFDEVKRWEGSLSGGTQLTVGAAMIDSLMRTKVTFGNPTDNLVALTPKVMVQAGVELNAIRRQQMRDSHDFYYMTIPVHMRPEPGAQFKALRCQLDFGPKGEQEPIVQNIFPQPKWKEVLKWGGSLSLGLDGNLDWNAGVDASKVAAIINLPADLKAKVANKNKLKSFIVIPDYTYQEGRFDIAAYGEGNSECFWDIQEPDLQQTLTMPFGVVFKVPKNAPTITLRGTAWAEPSMNWFVANIRNVFSDLSEKLQTLLKQKAASKFARGTAEEWMLPLPVEPTGS